MHKVETTRRLLFPTDLPEEETVHLGSTGRPGHDEPTSNFFPGEREDTPRSTHSTTSRQDVNMIESRTSRVSDMEASPSTPRIFTSKPTSFSDILPPQSINPPKLVGAKSFNELLKKPTIINNIEDPFQPSSNLRSSNEQIEMDKRKQMIKEALERIKKNRIKLENVRYSASSEGDKGRIITEGGDTMRFQPVPSIQQGPGDRWEEGCTGTSSSTASRERGKLEFVSLENKFTNTDYDEQNTWKSVLLLFTLLI